MKQFISKLNEYFTAVSDLGFKLWTNFRISKKFSLLYDSLYMWYTSNLSVMDDLKNIYIIILKNQLVTLIFAVSVFYINDWCGKLNSLNHKSDFGLKPNFDSLHGIN